MPLISGLYKGFSSFEFQKTKSFSLRDIELVKMDLLNHIFTKRGERVMMPTFGTLIPELVFEPLDDNTVEIIEDELQFVFDFDPRVEVLSLEVRPDFERSSVTASAELFYVEFQQVDNFDLNIIFEE